MILKVNKKELVDAVNIVQKAIAAKSPIPILEGILVEAKDQTLILRGTDVDVSIETSFTTEIHEEGKIVVDSRMFGDIIRKLPNNIITLETADNNTVTISAEKSVLNLLYMDPSDFPVFPEVEQTTSLDISQAHLKNMVRKVLTSIATEDTRPILMGMLFETADHKLNMVGLDGYRMAMVTEDLETDIEIKRVISGKTLRDLLSVIQDTDDTVRLAFTDNHVLFELGNTRIISRLLQGDYLKYQNMIPDYSKLSVIVDKNEFRDATERASVLANEGTSNLIKFMFEDNTLIITSNSKMGKMREEVYCEMTGEPLEIAFNAKYIIDILKTMDEDKIVMEMTSNISPCIIRPEDNDKSLYLVLPVRIAR